MKNYNEVTSNLIELAKNGQFDIIAHGCNCQNVMGAGIAKQIRAEFPSVFIADQQTEKGDFNKLGNLTYADIIKQHEFSKDLLGDPKIEEIKFRVYNCYTQYNYGTDRPQLDYAALSLCLKKLNYLHPNKRIGLPLIGCSLAGGNWNIVKEIIKEELKDMYVTIVHYKPNI